MKLSTLVLGFVVFLSSFSLSAPAQQLDSLPQPSKLSLCLPDSSLVPIDSLKHEEIIRRQKRVLDSRFYQITHISVPLIAIGAISFHKDQAFSNMRNNYIPRFRFHYDDYLQYASGALMLGLKLGGVKGRSTWPRMLVSDAFSAGIMGIMVNSLKYTVKRMRPDGSSRNSYPSGHTATAFMLATMLSKEYGSTRSPLYSVAGYSMAVSTAISRQLNNRHWFSDVLSGAGIGILSTELGYYFADLLFKNKGLVLPELKWNPHSENENFSFIGIQMGYSTGEHGVNLPLGIEMKGYGGAISSLTAGYSLFPHWQVVTKISASQSSPAVNSDKFFAYHKEISGNDYDIQPKAINFTNFALGMQYVKRLIPGLYLGGSVMGGLGLTSTYKAYIHNKFKDESNVLLQCKPDPVPNIDISAHLMHVTEHNLGLKLFVSYNIGWGHGRYSYYPPESSGQQAINNNFTRITLRSVFIGAEVNALFWK